MINLSSLPYSEATRLEEVEISIQGVQFTFEEQIDERKIYNELNNRLCRLETSLETNQQEVASIEEESNRFRIAFEEKEEVLLRVDWLRRLYEVKDTIGDADTNEKVVRLRMLLGSVQTCPLKNELLDMLDTLENSLSEKMAPVELSTDQALMELAIEEAGDAFLNLGKEGREFVITDILKQFGKKATVEVVQKRTIALEESVKELVDVKEPNRLINRLESLPIPLFNALPIDGKVKIAGALLEKNKWNGLASLSRMIVLLDKAITKKELEQEEIKNTIVTSDGKAARTLNIKYIENGNVQLS